MTKEIRVRFAPSPTGPLHIGGVRTALYNYLFARKLGGKFLLRIEDTDQMRYVNGAEDYIVQSLNWLNLIPDESPAKGGDYGPYRQSERRHVYKEYVDKLLQSGHAYYAFDSSEEIELMRERMKENGIHSPKYDSSIRMEMRNSLTLSAKECEALLSKGENVVIRLKILENKQIKFKDEVRGEVSFDSNELDDKVLIKADGMPTYHLANVVDDHLMNISHVIRGEEWLSSTGHHVLLYNAFGWEELIPNFAHLPLILKPQGHGKLSKRDGAKFGFPVFPLDWYDKKENALFKGFREMGFLPEAVINFLVFLGWNPGTEQEIFSLAQLENEFDSTKIVKSGAKFNYDKAKWYNQQYIFNKSNSVLAEIIRPSIEEKADRKISTEYIEGFCALMKERVVTLNDFWDQGSFFFTEDYLYDEKTIRKKYKSENLPYFENLINLIDKTKIWSAEILENVVKTFINEKELSFGALFPILRVCISGTTKGPDLFGMMQLLGKERSVNRLQKGIRYCQNLKETIQSN